MQNIKALNFPVLKKESEFFFFLCSYVRSCDSLGGAIFDPQKHQMNKHGRGPQEDA